MTTPQPATDQDLALDLLANDLSDQVGRGGASFRRPEIVELAGIAIADAMRPEEPDVLLTWDSLDDAALAHVVARELRVRNSLVFEPQEGTVDFMSPPAPGQRVVLFAATFARRNSVRAPAALIRGRGAELVLVAAILDTVVARTEAPTLGRYLAMRER
jgi:hypothetical protein